MENNLSRRRFLETSAAALGVSLLGCGSKTGGGAESGAVGSAGRDETPAAKATGALLKANPDGSFALAGAGAVAKGTALSFAFPNGEPGLFYVTKSGERGAVSAKCTHAGCTVQWADDVAVPLRCPCHQSNFALDGHVLGGPAKAPLAHYNATLQGDVATLRRV